MNPGTLRREIRFGNSLISYRLEHTARRRTVNIAVDPRRGVLMKAPVSLPGDRLTALMRRKAPWILERRRKLRELSRPWRREFVSGESFTYLGRNYRLKVARDGSSPTHAALVGKRLRVVVGRHDARARAVRKALWEWYQRRAAARLPERAAFWAKKLGVSPPPVIIREQAKRWGSCDRKGRLLLNWRIVLAPLSLVDYVIAHEACHLVHPDHGPAFWKLLGRVVPDWESRRERLRREGSRYCL